MWNDLTEFEQTLAKICGGGLLLLIIWCSYVIFFVM